MRRRGRDSGRNGRLAKPFQGRGGVRVCSAGVLLAVGSHLAILSGMVALGVTHLDPLYLFQIVGYAGLVGMLGVKLFKAWRKSRKAGLRVRPAVQFCPPGLLALLGLHAVLLVGDVCFWLHHGEVLHLMPAGAYLALCALLGMKFFKLRRDPRAGGVVRRPRSILFMLCRRGVLIAGMAHLQLALGEALIGWAAGEGLYLLPSFGNLLLFGLLMVKAWRWWRSPKKRHRQ